MSNTKAAQLNEAKHTPSSRLMMLASAFALGETDEAIAEILLEDFSAACEAAQAFDLSIGIAPVAGEFYADYFSDGDQVAEVVFCRRAGRESRRDCSCPVCAPSEPGNHGNGYCVIPARGNKWGATYLLSSLVPPIGRRRSVRDHRSSWIAWIAPAKPLTRTHIGMLEDAMLGAVSLTECPPGWRVLYARTHLRILERERAGRA